MGFLSSLTKGIGNLLGVGESSTKYARKAADADLAFQQKGLDFLMGVLDPRLQREGAAADELFGYYMGEEDAQQALIDRARMSPFYESMLDQGRQGVGAALSATGSLRGGMGPTSFYQQDQKVLKDLVDEQLRGLSYFAQPTDVSGVPAIYGSMGDTAAGKYQAIGQAKQDKYANMLNLGKLIAGAI